MKYKTTIGIIVGIFLLASVSAIYAGECETIDLSGMSNPEDLVYTVVGNSSNTIGMNISSNGINATVCFVVNYKPDNFTLIFMDKVEKEVIKEVTVYRGGGGGTRTVYVDKNVTEYIEVPVDKIVYVENKTVEKCEEPITEEKEGFFKRFIEWIKRLFSQSNENKNNSQQGLGKEVGSKRILSSNKSSTNVDNPSDVYN